MIKLILGQPGSGKTLYAVHEMLNSPYFCYTNIAVRKMPHTYRLKTKDIAMKENADGRKYIPNWPFWETARKKHKEFHIVLDEVHNILHSRRSMSGWNIGVGLWLAQIRKLLGQSEKTHLYLISQRLYAIDVSARDLAHDITWCEKVKAGKDPVFILYRFTGPSCIERFQLYLYNGRRTWDTRLIFKGKQCFPYYDSYAFVTFGTEGYL